MLKVFWAAVFLTSISTAKDLIRVGSSPAISTAGIYLAQEKGYFKDEGLNVELIIFNNSGAPMTLLMSKGDLDVGAGNLSAGLFNAVNKGEKFKIVADKGHVNSKNQYIGLLVRKDLFDSKKYSTLKDLKGKKVSLPSLDGISQQVVLSKMLKSVGLKDSDVELVKLSYAEASVALKTKAIDATITIEPYLSKSLLEKSAVMAASSNDFVPNQQSAVIIYSPHFAEKRKADAIKFMKAYLRGIRFYNSSLKNDVLSEEAISLLKKHIKIEDDAIWKNMRPIGLNDDGRVLTESIDDDLAWYLEKGFIKKVPEKALFMDPTFAEAASKEKK